MDNLTKNTERITHKSQEIIDQIVQLNQPITIFIAGVFGAGKTSLSYNLSCHLKIKQRSSLGMITKTIMYLQRTNPLMRSLNKLDQNKNEFPKFMQQSKEICSIVNFITKVSRADGVSYIIDGVQLHPNHLTFDDHTLFLFLSSGGKEVLKKQLKQSTTHRDRYKNTTDQQVDLLIELELQLLSQMKLSSAVQILSHSPGEEEQLLAALNAISVWLQSIRANTSHATL